MKSRYRLLARLIRGPALLASAACLPGPQGSVNLAIDASANLGNAEREIPAALEEVWGVLGPVHEDLQIPIDTEMEILASGSEAERWEMGNEGYQPRSFEGRALSGYLDCGRRRGFQNADQYRVTMSIFTRLRYVDDNRTLIWTEIVASAKPRGATGLSIPCVSKGLLELRVAQLVVERLEVRASNRNPAA